jgi:hypothetical protein
VAYDIFTAATATGSSEYEIMIWLAALGGAGPISSTGSPVATPSIDGTTWNLFSGPNGATTVYSFVAQSEVTNFSGDLLAFLTYLAENQSFSTSQFVTSIGAGSEPFTGTDAVLTVSAYSVVFNLGGSTKTTTSSAVSKKTSSTSKSSAPVSTSTGTSPLYGQCGRLNPFKLTQTSLTTTRWDRLDWPNSLLQWHLHVWQSLLQPVYSIVRDGSTRDLYIGGYEYIIVRARCTYDEKLFWGESKLALIF